MLKASHMILRAFVSKKQLIITITLGSLILFIPQVLADRQISACPFGAHIDQTSAGDVNFFGAFFSACIVSSSTWNDPGFPQPQASCFSPGAQPGGNPAFYPASYFTNGVAYKAIDYVAGTDTIDFQCDDFIYNQENVSIASGTLQQYKSDATTTIPEDSFTSENAIVFGGTLESSSTDPLKLEIEIATSTANFSGTPTATSGPVLSGNIATTSVPALIDGSYFWRARVLDSSTTVTSDWQEFGTAGEIDFRVHQVPLITQVTSPFPGIASTSQWSSLPFANGLGNKLDDPNRCGPNIANCGCAITSVAMLAQYYGLKNGVDGNAIDPGTINAWLESNNGYDPHGNLKWAKITEYAQDFANGIALRFDNVGSSISKLNQQLGLLQPTILYERALGHFIVADDQLVDTYKINDPDFFLTNTLNDNVINTTSTHNYHNHFDTFRLFSSVLTGSSNIAAQGIMISLGSPAELLITDPSGHRLGKDPVSSTSYNEIPDANYDSEGISDGSQIDPNPPTESKFAWIPTPLSGNYDIKVIGTGSGPFTLQTLSYDAQGNGHNGVITGSTTLGRIADYQLNFTPENSSTVLLLATSTFTPSADTYLKQSDANQNFGTATLLRIEPGGNIRAGIIQFDQSQLLNVIGASSTVLSAKLQFSIISNGGGWGNAGELDASSLARLWTETGATWNCPNDINTMNSNLDCPGGTWSILGPSFPYNSVPTATTTITDTMNGTITFDVTVDIRNFLSGASQNDGWIIKEPSGNDGGSIDLDARESANPPQLIVTYGQNR